MTRPSTLPYWAGTLALVALIAAMQQLDGDLEHITAAKLADDASTQRLAAVQARRDWLARRDVCHRAYGPQTEPAELPDGTYTCRDARGRMANPAHTTVALASKGGAL